MVSTGSIVVIITRTKRDFVCGVRQRSVVALASSYRRGKVSAVTILSAPHYG